MAIVDGYAEIGRRLAEIERSKRCIGTVVEIDPPEQMKTPEDPDASVDTDAAWTPWGYQP